MPNCSCRRTGPRTANAVGRRASPRTWCIGPSRQIALEEVDRAKANGVHLDWLTFDEGYGKAPEFLCGLDERQLLFVGEVPKSLSCLAVNGSGRRPDAR